MQEEHGQYDKNENIRLDVLLKDVDVIEDANLNEKKSKDKKKEIKVVGESSRFLSFCERMRGLSPHRRTLK